MREPMSNRNFDFQFGPLGGRGWLGLAALAILCSTFAFVAWQIPAVGVAGVAALRKLWGAP
jgi:hypothetical protein